MSQVHAQGLTFLRFLHFKIDEKRPGNIGSAREIILDPEEALDE